MGRDETRYQRVCGLTRGGVRTLQVRWEGRGVPPVEETLRLRPDAPQDEEDGIEDRGMGLTVRVRHTATGNSVGSSRCPVPVVDSSSGRGEVVERGTDGVSYTPSGKVPPL